MIPGAVVAGRENLFSPPETEPAEHIAKVLAAIGRAALDAASHGGLFLNYDRLPDKAWPDIVRHFGLKLEAGDEDRVAAAAARDAKTPGIPWQDDRAARQAAATAVIRTAADKWTGEIFRELRAR
jgi:hypothetical protein